MSAGIDLDVDVVVDLRRHEHRRERRVAAIARIERALAHQPVHAGLGAQPAIGVVALERDRALLMPATSPALESMHLGLEAALLRPSAGTCASASAPSPALRCRRRRPGCRDRRCAHPSRRGTCAGTRAARTFASSCGQLALEIGNGAPRHPRLRPSRAARCALASAEPAPSSCSRSAVSCERSRPSSCAARGWFQTSGQLRARRTTSSSRSFLPS